MSDAEIKHVDCCELPVCDNLVQTMMADLDTELKVIPEAEELQTFNEFSQPADFGLNYVIHDEGIVSVASVGTFFYEDTS
ncbi:hypothetical protein BgiBS90_012195, partial [Biomphalaria glabrata]